MNLDNLIENTTYSVFVRSYLDKIKGILSANSNTIIFTPKINANQYEVIQLKIKQLFLSSLILLHSGEIT